MHEPELEVNANSAFFKLAYHTLVKQKPLAVFRDGHLIDEKDREDLFQFIDNAAKEFEQTLNKQKIPAKDIYLSVAFCTLIARVIRRVMIFADLNQAVDATVDIAICLLNFRGIYPKRSVEELKREVLSLAYQCLENDDKEFEVLKVTMDKKFSKWFSGSSLIPNLDAFKSVIKFGEGNFWRERGCLGLTDDLKY